VQSFKAWGAELEMIFKVRRSPNRSRYIKVCPFVFCCKPECLNVPLQDFDGDGNGLMDREELCVGLRTLGADVPDEQCDWLFDQVRRRLWPLAFS